MKYIQEKNSGRIESRQKASGYPHQQKNQRAQACRHDEPDGQIENGAVNPSIPTLRTISSALETPIYYFFKDEDNASVVVTQSTRMVLGNKQEPSVVYELLTPDTRGEIEFCMMVIPPKAYSCRESKGHFGEEVAFFYSGEEVQLEIDGDSYTLHHEDSIRIPGGAMHRWYNPTDETVQVIFAVSPPSF